MINIPCIIFAGGKSSRMGEDKSLLPFGSSPTMTQYQLHKLENIFTKVYISCKSKNKFHFEANFIEDIPSDATYAPTAGFISTYKELTSNKFFVISVDTPFITEKVIKKIIEQDSEDNDATIAKTDIGIQPMCGIYHRSLEKEFITMLKENNHKLGFLLKSSNTKFVPFEDDKAFLNLNNPQDYKEALTLI